LTKKEKARSSKEARSDDRQKSGKRKYLTVFDVSVLYNISSIYEKSQELR